MATDEPIADATEVISSIESDYGSDLDDDTWDRAFSQSQTQRTQTQPVLSIPRIAVEEVDELEADIIPKEDETPPSSLRIARIREHLVQAIAGLDKLYKPTPTRSPERAKSIEIEYDQSNRRSFSPLSVESLPQERRSHSAEPQPAVPDTRSPIERFRTKPKKTLSVTDIVSPAWCELKYWYSLTKYGRVRQTKAMKQGSKIHKEKEREVHTEVPVETATKEDQFGLQLWNIIQGLRTLQATGLTRELEVLGIVQGEVIVGIIDELSFTCPDEAMEASILEAGETPKTSGQKRAKPLPADQKTMGDYYASSQSSQSSQIMNMLEAQGAWPTRRKIQTLYLSDIKTRQAKALPTPGAAMRGTEMQLMLYRRLISDIAANKVDPSIIFDRKSLDPNTLFSDTFIASIASIDLQPAQRSLEADDQNDELSFSSQPDHDSLEEILSHNTLSTLWSHMIAEFARVIAVTSTTSSISPLLTAEFRASSDGALLGRRSFPYNEAVLEKYVTSEMAWWKGEREACGVEIEEAFKCGSCEFAEGCTWRQGKIEEATKKARLRNASKAGMRNRSQI
ncbi:hypothetical protein DOTSEDRAFT_73024 [Dothistroma septosporum NZE10]|uniref:Exonuclease V n=1 Tax=Dothistroma septosporum (strain NZE10 / CBS 128990) TaxID=675120 RepID=N1PJ23_DOTSN|nr:hypothetical protein DOTSEDRAFT_73024 [Dothistroma septosporum NZE10]